MNWSTLALERKDKPSEKVLLLPNDEDDANYYGAPFDSRTPVVYPKADWRPV